MKVADMRSVYMLEQVWHDGASKPILVSHQADAIDAWLGNRVMYLETMYNASEQVFDGWNTREGYSRIHVMKRAGTVTAKEEYRVWILDFDPTVSSANTLTTT